MKRMPYSFCAEQKERRNNERSLRHLAYHTNETFSMAGRATCEKEQQFVQVVSLMDLNKHMRDYRWIGIGRRREDRALIAKAFVAKEVYNFDTTKVLIEYLCSCKNLRPLCGWETRGDIPSESTFS
jgi:hypothetical protein